MSKQNKEQISPLQYSIISLISLIICISLLVLLLNYKSEILALGFSNKVYYIILIPVALSSSAFLFGAMKAHAAYNGKILSGNIELKGAVVLFLIVLIGGFRLVPKDENAYFNFKCKIENKIGSPIENSDINLTLSFGQNYDNQSAKEHGVFTFSNIPMEFLEDSVDIQLTSENWRFANNTQKIRLVLHNKNIHPLKLNLKEKCTIIYGKIDTKEYKFENLTISLKGTNKIKIQPDNKGYFTIKIPEKIQNEERNILKVFNSANNETIEIDVYPCQKNDITFPI